MGNHDMTDSLERPGVLKDVKVVMVGPKKSGKTSLVQRFVNDTFSDTYVPTGFEKYSTKCKVDENTIQYSIWDTSGSGAYDSVRPLAYHDANVFLLCFNIGDPDSLDQAINKWHPEIISHCNTTPIILCGCRADTKNNIEQISYLTHIHKMPVTTEHILNACKKIQAMAYVETSTVYSSLTVPEAFEVAAKAALGILNNKVNTKKQKKINNNQNNTNNNNNNQIQNQNQNNQNHNNHTITTKNNKTNIKNELKGRVKNTCCVM